MSTTSTKIKTKEHDMLMRVKHFLESISNLTTYLNNDLQKEYKSLYTEVYNKINPEHTI